MQRLLLALLLVAPAALSAQDNPNYDPDYDGDGCYSVADILGLLPLFGSCAPFSCGDSLLLDNYWYVTTLVGDQCWFAENLRTTVYANGDLIPAGLTDGEWTSTTSGASAVYGEGSVDCYQVPEDNDACDEAWSLEAFGRLYNWYAVDDARSLCPPDWHVPTDDEWTELENYVSDQCLDGDGAMVLKSTSGWAWSGSGNGTDELGFSALPGGFRDGGTNYYGFWNVHYEGYWWSSTQSGGSAWRRILFTGTSIERSLRGKRWGYSVRCLKDVE